MAGIENQIDEFVEEETDYKHIRDGIENWLHTNKVSQAFFAKDVLHRSQGTFCGYLRHPVKPRTELGKQVWTTMNNFLEDLELQDSTKTKFHQSVPRGNLRKNKNDGRKIWAPYQKAMLDTLYMKHKGNLSNKTKKSAATLLDTTPEKVRIWFNNHRQKEKNGLYTPGQYQQSEDDN